MRRTLGLALWVVLMLAISPISAAGATDFPAGGERRPLVLAAASLREAMDAAAGAWTAQGHPRPVISLAASSALAQQIEAGAPADIFVSADEEWMDHIAAKGLIRPASRVDFVSNALVLIAPADSTMALKIAKGFPLAAALGTGRLATGDVNSVPAGIYAKQALTRLGVWESVSDKIAGAANVRSALLLVAQREAPLGIVYATDAKAEPKVRVVATFPEASHDPIHYPLAVLATSTNPEAENFRRFLLSPSGKAIFRAYGFGTR